MELDGTVSEGLSFGSGRELFDNGLKYLNKLIGNHVPQFSRNKIFETNIFVTCKPLPKFMKILSHETLEPCGYVYNCS